MAFCISAVVLTTSSCFVDSLVSSYIFFFMLRPRAPIVTGIILTVYLGLLSLVSKALCRYRTTLSLRFLSIFCYMGHTMLEIQICFSSFISSIKLGLHAVLVFHRFDWKLQTSLASSLSKTILNFHYSLYNTVSALINLCCFAQMTASITMLYCVLLSIFYYTKGCIQPLGGPLFH